MSQAQSKMPRCVVLDAMGVIYPFADDVAELLVPFVQEKNSGAATEVIEQAYYAASLGKLSSAQFWEKVGLSRSLEDEYMSRFRLSDGLLDFLAEMNDRQIAVWCLSNDLSEWSRKLRRKFELEKLMHGFLISADVMVRKPDPAIYKYLVKVTEIEAQDTLLVDDRPANLDTAAQLGFNTVLFLKDGLDTAPAGHRRAGTFKDLTDLVSQTGT